MGPDAIDARSGLGQPARPYRRKAIWRGHATLWLAGLFTIFVGSGALAGATPALATSPLSWSSPTLVDSHAPEGPGLNGVSCASSWFCVAVDGYGDVLASSDPTGGAGAWHATRVDESFHEGRRLSGVSCVSVSLCVAVDTEDNILVSSDPAGGAGYWSMAHVPHMRALLGVSCVAGPLCVAVGGRESLLASTDPAGGLGAWSETSVGDGRILGISCASSSLCVAVDEHGDVISATDPTGGAGAWKVSHVDGEDEISGVSCPSVGFCVAVDSAGNVLTSTDPTGGASAWSETKVDADPLWSVSCSSETLCVATDSKGNVLTAIEPARSVSAWSAAHVDPVERLYGVSCTSGLCVAVDGHGSVLSSANPSAGLASWSTAQVGSPNVTLLSVSCPSTEMCVALDQYDDVVSSTDPTGGEGAWSTREVISKSESPPRLLGLSCPSTSLCVAGDEAAVYASTNPASTEDTWIKEITWEYPISLYGEGEELFGPFASVSCVSVRLCMASLDTDDEYDPVLFSIEPLGGEAAWITPRALHFVGPRNGPPANDRDPTLGVSCAPVGLCATVDLAGNVVTMANPGSTEDAVIAGVAKSPLLGISCPSASLCVAVDSAGDVVASSDPMGGLDTWSVVPVDPDNHLTAVSCVSESLCVAVDAAGNVLSWTYQAGGSDGWSTVRADPGHAFNSVSCTPAAAGLCVAIDNAGDAVTSSFSAANVGEPVPPTVESVAATSKSTEATVEAHADTNALAGTCEVQYGTSESYGSSAPCGTGLGSINSQLVSAQLMGLELGTRYYYRVVAENHAGKSLTSEGKGTFTTQTVTPGVTGEFVSEVGTTTAVLTGTLDSEMARTRYYFEYGESEAYGQKTPGGEAAASAGEVQVGPETITGLKPGTTYYYRLRAVNAWHEAVGETKTFTTLMPGQSGGGESGGSHLGGSLTSTGPSLPPPPIVLPSELKILSVKVKGDGQVVLTLQAPAAGAIDVRATVSIREAAAGSRKRKTKRIHQIIYGMGSATAYGADTMTVTIKPTSSALGALKGSRMLRVPVTIVFHPHSGLPTTVSETVTVRYQPPRHSPMCSASKGACRAKR